MKVHVTYEYQDIENYYAFISAHPKYKRIVQLHNFKSSVIAGVLGGVVLYFKFRELLFPILFGLAIAIVYYVLAIFRYKSAQRAWSEATWTSSPQNRSFEINNEGLQMSDKDSALMLYWHKISSIESNEAYLFFEVDGSGFYQIPRHAFSSPQESERFLETARALQAGKTLNGSWWTQGQSVVEEQSTPLEMGKG